MAETGILEAQIGLPRDAILRADRQAVGLALGVVTSDVAEMEALFSKARTLRRSNPMQAALLLEQAIALYQGPFLSGTGEIEDGLLLERHRLEAVFQEIMRSAVIAEAAAGRLAPALEYARRLLQIDAENDNDCALLMRLLAQTGDAAGAWRVYADFPRGLRRKICPCPISCTGLRGKYSSRKNSRRQRKNRSRPLSRSRRLPPQPPLPSCLMTFSLRSRRCLCR